MPAFVAVMIVAMRFSFRGTKVAAHECAGSPIYLKNAYRVLLTPRSSRYGYLCSAWRLIPTNKSAPQSL